MTTFATAPCPGCGNAMSRIADHGVRYDCACGGRMLGIAPFEHQLESGTGARLWIASEAGDPAGACPFCTRPMHGVPEANGGPPGMAACHTCGQVWLPAPAVAWLGGHATGPTGAPGVAAAPAHPPRCDDCGAPWQPDDGGRCRFCHAQLSTPEPVVVMMAPAPRPADTLVNAIADLFER